jgi:membrane fusion protein
LASERQSVYSDLQKIPLQVRTQSAALDRSISEIDQQIREHALSRATIVRAPQDGVVSGIVGGLGTTVQPTTSLASLVPAGAKLEAHLYAPSRSIGFIKPGEKVRLHYQAYPSEKFGWQEGVISEVSSVALSPAEYLFRVGETAQEPMYEITVSIPEPTITLYGQAHPLQVGMVLEGDILLQQRRLIEWIFAPLRDLKGRVAG